jgi:hypothetical protein
VRRRNRSDSVPLRKLRRRVPRTLASQAVGDR